MESAHLPNGTLIQGGKYKIVHFIGSGGFGCTYEGEHTMLQRRVAIKEFFVRDFCNRDMATSHVKVGTEGTKELVDKLRGKFVAEARATSQMQHPNIVKVYDVFEENGTAYYVMDYLESPSLEKIVRDSGPMSERTAVGYIRQIADALAYVHSLNRLHLDVKPANIMTDGLGNAILVDFGVSKQYDEAGGENTSTLMGKTPGYAPIEQIGNNVTTFTPATDIYALGATLYKLLTGITPPGSNLLASGEELQPLPSDVSEGTARAILASMQTAKSKRPQRIAEFLALLDSYEEIGVDTILDTPVSVDSQSLFELACRYHSGDGVTQDNEKAINMLRESAEQGCADAQYIIGACYGEGDGVPVDLSQAIFWWKKAVEQGHSGAHYTLGSCYEKGIGVPLSISEALRLFTEPARKGDKEATDKLGLYGMTASSMDTKANLINGYEFVDLGLSVLWASKNVGASSPSDYGYYYAWGETKEKSSYDRSNCLTHKIKMGYLAHNTEYDAARAVWSTPWRLPLASEIDELIESCTREWISQGGHQGYRLTGPNGNSIFLPAAGFRDGTSLRRDGKNGYYWSNTPYERNNRTAYGLSFGKSYANDLGCATPYSGDSRVMYMLRLQSGCFFRFWHSRYPGQSVRPVVGPNYVYKNAIAK